VKKVLIYSTQICPYCVNAKQLLQSEGISFEEINVEDEKKRAYMEQISGRRTVPQIFIGERHVGGFDDLKALYERGELNDWLKD
jgi:glutaredoxin 3